MGWSASHACDSIDSGHYTTTIMMLTGSPRKTWTLWLTVPPPIVLCTSLFSISLHSHQINYVLFMNSLFVYLRAYHFISLFNSPILLVYWFTELLVYWFNHCLFAWLTFRSELICPCMFPCIYVFMHLRIHVSIYVSFYLMNAVLYKYLNILASMHTLIRGMAGNREQTKQKQGTYSTCKNSCILSSPVFTPHPAPPKHDWIESF